MIDKQKKYELLNRILQNKEFSNSEIIKKLLTYLVDCSVEERIPKEYTIAAEVFNKEQNFDPTTDTTVRVYVHRLRKKLEYYFSTAKHEKIRMVIPKGNYDIRFVTYKKDELKTRKYFFIIVLLVTYIVISHLFFVFVYKPRPRNLYPKLTHFSFWSDLFEPQKPPLVAMGDHFFYEDYRTHTLQRRDNINSKEDFYQYLASLDSAASYYWILPFTFFPRNSVWPFQQFQSSLLANKKYELKPASLVIADDVDKLNILFVGSFHTLGILKETFRNSHFQFVVFPNSLTVKDGEETHVIQEGGNPTVYHYDYGVVRKFLGPNGNTIYIFSSFHETGTIGIVQYFTDAAKIKELESQLEDKFGYVPEYFELLFKATGYNRTNFSTEILYIFEVLSEQKFW